MIVSIIPQININKELLSRIGIVHSIIDNNDITKNDENTKNVKKYLDSLTYETIYKRELNKLLVNLPNICISNISSKKILNYSESKQQDPREAEDLNDDRQNDFIEVN